MIAFDSVTAGYGKRIALCELTARFAHGAVTGIVGPNGAGKTTLLRVSLGILPIAQGSLRIGDRPLSQWSREALARTVAYLPQGGQAHWSISAENLVALGRLPHRDRNPRAIAAALERADAAGLAGRPVDELSAGERARVLVARALATEPEVLLADEPAAWLDPAHQLRLMALLREEAARGVAVAVTLHDLALASRFCDAIVVLQQGRLVATELTQDTLAEVFGVRAVTVSEDGEHAILPWTMRTDNDQEAPRLR
ncbi:MAG: ABC transporter ATP-binding protein [Alphaproteobacteria bacterium]|nr:ABC transporter ATP-binding protein [Alphaproteobacteria bacterium]MBV9693873.1 ABC transporter ATP-binding protein [Alphaproteobacteria bacterium]